MFDPNVPPDLSDAYPYHERAAAGFDADAVRAFVERVNPENYNLPQGLGFSIGGSPKQPSDKTTFYLERPFLTTWESIYVGRIDSTWIDLKSRENLASYIVAVLTDLPYALRLLRAALARVETLETELADAAAVLQKALPIGQVKHIGLREVAEGVRVLARMKGSE